MPGTSSIKFFIKNAGFTTEGTFEKFGATLSFDPTNPSAAKLNASAEVASLNTGIGLRDKHLKDPDYFDAATYPRITFTGERFERNGNQWQVVGRLQIKSVTQTVTLLLTITEIGDRKEFKTQFTVNRLTYTVGKSHWTLSNDVRVEVMLVCP